MSEQESGLKEQPRLLTAAQTAAYLGFKGTQILKSIPINPHVIGKSLRWDRHALDRWLDGLGGLEGRGLSGEEDVIDEIRRHFQTV